MLMMVYCKEDQRPMSDYLLLAQLFSCVLELTSYVRVDDIHYRSLSFFLLTHIQTHMSGYKGEENFLFGLLLYLNTNTITNTLSQTRSWMAQRASYWLKQWNNMSASGDFDSDTCQCKKAVCNHSLYFTLSSTLKADLELAAVHCPYR